MAVGEARRVRGGSANGFAGKPGARATARPPAANLYRYFEALGPLDVCARPGPALPALVSESASRSEVIVAMTEHRDTATAQRGAGNHRAGNHGSGNHGAGNHGAGTQLGVLDRGLHTAPPAGYAG